MDADPVSPPLAGDCRFAGILALFVALGGCATQAGPAQPPAVTPLLPDAQPFRSTYRPPPSPPTLIRNAAILTGTGERIERGDILFSGGRIEAIGGGLAAPPGARVIEAAGRWVTPGIIDVHSHVGVSPSPSTLANEDDTEYSATNVANAWVEHSAWPLDPGFQAALEGGVTTLQLMPGSANLFPGRTVVVKNVPSVTYQGMKFPEVPQGLKLACGENPKRDFGLPKGVAPQTRMASVAGQRQAFLDAQNYQRRWEHYEQERRAYEAEGRKGGLPPVPPQRDLGMESLAAAMRGELPVHVHCYRADDIATILDLASEFGFRIAAIHHGTDAYKIADLVAERGVCVATWADWWGFKMEAYDGIQENVALLDYPEDSCAIIHSDSIEGIQHLNQEAAKAMARGQRAGFRIAPERAIRWITGNAAKALAIDRYTGTLERGKAADIVIWNRDPLSVYALADQVFIDGALLFDREHRPSQPRSDFMLGQPGNASTP